MTNEDPDTTNIKSIRRGRKELGGKVTLWITPKRKENWVKSRSSSLKKLRGTGFPTMVEKKQSMQTAEKFQINSVQLQNSQQKHKIKRNNVLFNRSKISTMTSNLWTITGLSLIHIWRCRRIERCRSRWSPYH